MRIFVSGGCKNGKSTWAETMAARQRAGGAPLYYVATMRPCDDEDRARVARHVAERSGKGFTTVELPVGIGRLPALCRADGSFLVDSLTALLSNEMFPASGFDACAPARVAAQLGRLLQELQNVVLVSDHIYTDAGCYDALTQQYRRGLALLDRTCAARCDIVAEACAGTLTLYKGELPW